MVISASAARQHGVVFYDADNKFLCEAIVDFCVRALRTGDPLVVIATRQHLGALQGKLRERGFDWESACRAGKAAGHDAEALLDEISVAGSPDPARFGVVMDRVMQPWADLGEGYTVRAFGEMVDVLCRRGKVDAAAELEEMWNELARTHRFTLLCAYSMGNLYREVNGSGYRRICDAHDHVLPWTAPEAPVASDEPGGPADARV